jgi:TRAP-type C4-dicarboxylate transport system substrate-binding protein
MFHDRVSRWLTGATALVALTVGGAGAVEARSLSIGTQTVQTAFLAPAIQAYADRIRELTNGELEPEVFWAAQLGSAAQMNQSLAAGALDIEVNVIELLSAFEPALGVMSMPLVFRDREHFALFLGSEVFDEMQATLASKGIIFPHAADFKDPATAKNWIRPWDRGLLANKPIYTPDDLAGFKIRMYESEIPIKSWQALGANIQVVPWPDVYTSLATGVVDGLTGTVVDNYEMKHFENAPYWTNVHEYFQVQMPFMSKITYDSLTPEQQVAVKQAATDVGPIFKELMDSADAAARIKAQADFGVTFIEPPIAPWIAKMAPAHADFEARGLIAPGMIARIQAIK